MTASTWYERQKERDIRSRAQSEALLGPEKDIFAEFMELTASCLDAVFAGEQRDEIQTRRKVEFANHAFNLLWSAWDEALCGRFDASRGHSRSVSECCEFMIALIADPGIADGLGSNTKDVRRARRAIRDALNRQDIGSGKAFFELMDNSARAIQALSHVTHEAAAGVLPVVENGDKNIAVIRLGGFVSRVTLRLVAVPLAGDAAQLFGVASAGFIDVVQVGDDLWMGAVKRANDLVSGLGKELDLMRATSKGPISEIYLARSDEELMVT